MTFMLVASPFVLQSCDDDDGYSLGNFVVRMATIRVEGGNVYSLEIDNGQKLWVGASDVYWYKPTDGQRAIVNYTLLADREGDFDHVVKVNYLSDVLTKPVDDLTEENEEEFGNDGALIEDMWIGGNYLNVQFRFYLPSHYRHRVSLVKNTTVEDPEDGYIHLEYRYNNQDDVTNVWTRSFVSFYLGDYAPGKAADEYKGIIVKINSAINGEKELKYEFKKSEGNDRTISKLEEFNPTEGKVD